MPDSLTKRGPEDGRRINVHERWELRYWCKELGVTPKRLKQVVQEVGPMVKDARRRLRT